MNSPVDVTTIFKDSSNKNRDPDKYSKELGEAHCALWNSKKKLGFLVRHNMNKLVTNINGVEYVLTPDSITNGFLDSGRLIRDKGLTEKEFINTFGETTKALIKEYKDNDYTIGSSIIFPTSINGIKLKWTMNIARGLSNKIHDRFDYTLECIKRFYEGNKDNPLQSALERSEPFFRLFNSFQEYVNFFFLNDLVDEEGNIISFTGRIDFSHPFPDTEEKYAKYLKNTMKFVKRRNKRISQENATHSLQ